MRRMTVRACAALLLASALALLRTRSWEIQGVTSVELDFPAVAKAGAGTVEWMIVEFDEYAGDIFDGIRKSYTYLTSRGLARGRSS